jgi:hypothetical protein
MKNKTSLYTVLTMGALLGCLGMAEAQDTRSEPPTQPVLITPQLHNELTKGGTVSNGASISLTAALANDAVVTDAVAGWNYNHPQYCTVYWDGTTSWLYVYVLEGGYWFTSNLSFQNVIAPACQTGNLLAFYVYNLNGNLWNQVYTYTYK